MKPITSRPAPGWRTGQWFDSDRFLSLADFRDRVVALHAFQMLCPGREANGIPHRLRIGGLFEHREAMTVAALVAFIHEYRLIPDQCGRRYAGRG